MRVILTARSTLTPDYKALFQRFINILGATAKNPSNPVFDQYIFESISALIRYTICDFRCCVWADRSLGSPRRLPPRL